MSSDEDGSFDYVVIVVGDWREVFKVDIVLQIPIAPSLFSNALAD